MNQKSMENNGVGLFYKVTLEQFEKDYKDCFNYGIEKTSEEIKEIYDKIKLPERSTNGSAGYDFRIPVSLVLNKNGKHKIPTGIRCEIKDGWVLMIYVRSSIGFKYETVLTNGTGIIDSDYFNADNEGHIFVKLRNDGNKTLKLSQGDKFVQGVFLPYGLTIDDDTNNKRNGGIGSTGK